MFTNKTNNTIKHKHKFLKVFVISIAPFYLINRLFTLIISVLPIKCNIVISDIL